jgi:hypothetical protein
MRGVCLIDNHEFNKFQVNRESNRYLYMKVLEMTNLLCHQIIYLPCTINKYSTVAMK